MTIPAGECLACGHYMPLAVWDSRFTLSGLCKACLDSALAVRGPCSAERGCLCEVRLEKAGEVEEGAPSDRKRHDRVCRRVCPESLRSALFDFLARKRG